MATSKPDPRDPKRRKPRSRERPTPVREIMDTSPAPGGKHARGRSLEVDGEAWQVRTIGWTRSGTPPDVGAPLLLVGFARADEPDEYAKEALAVAGSIDDLSLDELHELFERSRPHRPRPVGSRGGRRG